MSERNQLDVPKPTTTHPLPAEGLLANAAKRVFRVTAIPLRNHPSPLLPINRRSALDCLCWRNDQKWGLKGGPKSDSQQRCADGDYFARYLLIVRTVATMQGWLSSIQWQRC